LWDHIAAFCSSFATAQKGKPMTWEDRLTLRKSVGHYAWAWSQASGLIEYYIVRRRGSNNKDYGELFRAPADNVIDLDTKCRIGRWKGPWRKDTRSRLDATWTRDAEHYYEKKGN
jgi:hypothetical protein